MYTNIYWNSHVSIFSKKHVKFCVNTAAYTRSWKMVTLFRRIYCTEIKGHGLFLLHFHCFCCLNNFQRQLFTNLFFWKRFSQLFRSGFRVPNFSGFRIPNQCGFRIPVQWIPDSNIKNLPYSGFRLLLHEAISGTFHIELFLKPREMCQRNG